MPATPYFNKVLFTPGIQAFWPLNEGPGEPAFERVSGKEGTPSGTGLTRAQPSLLPNGEGKSCLFDGVSGAFGIRPEVAGTLAEIADTLSVEAWIKPGAMGTERVIFTLGANAGELGIQQNGGKVLGGQQGVAGWAFSAAGLPEGVRAHVVVTKAGAERHVYVNGIDVTSLPANRTLEASALEKFIGRIAAAGFFYAGYLQYLSVYNVALPAATVREHFAAAHIPTFPRPTSIDNQIKAVTG